MTNTLDSILSGQNDIAPEQPPAPETPAPEQPRDEHGKFAPKPRVEAEPAPQAPSPVAPQAPQAGQEPPPRQAPVAAVVAERNKRQEAEGKNANLEAELASMRAEIRQLERMARQPAAPPQPREPPPPPPDVWQDPGAYMQHGIREALTPLQKQLEDQRDAFSRMFAEDKFGAETVTAAFSEMEKAFETDPGVQFEHQRIMASRNPYVELVSWHKRRQAQAEIGDDPAAYRERLKAELLAELQAGNGEQPPANPAAPKPAPLLPSNLANARGIGTRSGPAWGGPVPLQDIFNRQKK